MKTKVRQWLCAILHFGNHDYRMVVKEVDKHVLRVNNDSNQTLFRCRRCGKTKWFWTI